MKLWKSVGLYEFRNWPISALSFGQKKRVTIASILVLGAEIILLDEPTAGQDQKNYTEIMEFLEELHQQGHTIVMITHDMQLMLDYSDRALVMVDGELIADTDPASLLSNPELLVKANLKETSIFNIGQETRCGSTCFNGILQRKERRMQAKLIGYQHRDTVIHRLSGAGKLLFFILVSLAAMISYDTRLLVLIAIFSVFLLYLSEIRF